MPILTKPAVVKNVPTPFTLTKSLLAALPLVSSDPYFSVQLNWNKIVLVYKSSIGEQKSIVIFEASQEVPSGDFFISSKARNFFNVERIDIYDFDNDRISIPRSALNAIEFDIDMTPATATASVWDLFFGQTASTGAGELHSAGFGWGEAAYQTAPLTGNFTVTGTFHSVLGVGTNLMIGFKKDLPVSAGGPSFNISSAIYVDGAVGYMRGYNGADGTAGTAGNVDNDTADFSFEISRVGSVITGRVNGVSLFHDDNYSAPVYLAAMIYTNQGYSILGYTVA